MSMHLFLFCTCLYFRLLQSREKAVWPKLATRTPLCKEPLNWSPV
jgi:hypothetical protein